MRRLFAALSAGVVSLSGCGTMAHFQSEQALNGEYYGGVSNDIKGIQDGRVYLVPDLALSAVADTLLIPWYAYCFVNAATQQVPLPAADKPPASQPPTQPMPKAVPYAPPPDPPALSTTNGPPTTQPVVATSGTGSR